MIVLREDDNNLTLSFEEIDVTSYFGVYLQVVSDNFSGGDGEAIVTRSDLERFKVELVELEKTRQGVATLSSISELPNNHSFKVQCFSIDKLGHIGVSVDLVSAKYLQNKYFPESVSTSFEIEPGKLQIFLKDFSNLLDSISK